MAVDPQPASLPHGPALSQVEPHEACHPVMANPPPDLHAACIAGDTGAVQWALLCGADPSHHDAAGFSALHVAAARGHADVVRTLLERGASVRIRSAHPGACGGCSPLHAAVAAGHEGVVALLLSAGAEVDAHDEAGFAPLHTAALAGYCGIVKQLLLAGAASEPIVATLTPLDLGLQAGHHDVVGLLRQVTGRR